MTDTPQPKPLSKFFQRYAGAGAGDDRIFASALNRYFMSKYGSPGATSPGGRGAFGTAMKVAALAGVPVAGDPFQSVPVPGVNVALQEIIGSLFGQPSKLSAYTAPGQIDVTDPSVDPGTEKLSPLEGFLRKIRVISRAMGVGMFRGASVAPGTGLALAYEEGELARPRTKEDAMLHTIGAMLAGAVPFVGAGLLEAPVAQATKGVTSSVLRGAGIGGEIEAGAGVSKELLAELSARGVPGAPGVAGGFREATTAAGLMKGLAGDAAIGAGFGATEALAEGSLMRATGEGENAPNVLDMAKSFALQGLGLGALFRIPTSTQAIRIAKTMFRNADPIPPGGVGIAPGIVHDGIRSELVNGKLRFRREEAGTWIRAADLTEENLAGFRDKSQQKARDLVSDSPPGEGTAAAVAQSSAKKPETLPPDIASPEALAAQNTYGGMYLRRAEALVRHLGADKAERQLEELRKILWSDAPLTERLSAGGRVVALEQALGHPVRLPGQLPVELEAQAIETVAGLRPYGRAEIERAAVDARLSGRDAYGKRLWELMDSDLPKTYAAEINKRLAKANVQQARGVRAGVQGMFDGHPVEILQRPKLGLAWARRLDEAATEPTLVDVAKLKPFPKADQMAVLNDGRVVRVQAVDPQKGQILVAEVRGKNPGWVSVDEIKEVASSRSSFRSLEAQKAALIDEFQPTETIETPVPAVTTTGEPVTVIGIGEEGVKVKTKSGRVKTVPRDKIEPSEAAKAPVHERITEDLDALAVAEAQKQGRTVIAAFDTEAEAIAAATKMTGTNRTVGKIQDRYYVMTLDESVVGDIVPEEDLARELEGQAPPKPGESPPSLEVLRGRKSPGVGENMREDIKKLKRQAANSRKKGDVVAAEAAENAAAAREKALNPLAAADEAVTQQQNALDALDREVTTFAPGKVPQAGNRIRFFRVNPGKAKAFEAAWVARERIGKFVESRRLEGKRAPTAIQTHVFPQPSRGGDHLYAVELPESATSKKNYYGSANEALGALAGKQRVSTYASIVEMPEEIFSTGVVYRVPEELRSASIRPQEMLREMSQPEQTEYLRNLLVMNENVASEVAEPIAQAKVARGAIADAATLGDGQKLIEAESQLNEAHVQAAEALENIRVENSKPIVNKVIDDIAAADPEAEARQAFELEGLTPRTENYYYKQLHDLPTAQVGDPSQDALIANSLNVEGQRAFISKYEAPYVEYGTPGVTKPAGETQPAGLPYWTVEIVDPEGLTLRGATQKFDTPQQVAEYLSSEGYAHTLYKTHSGEYYHESNPALVGVLKPSKQGHGIDMTVKELPKKAETGFTPEQEELLIEFRELHRESASNGPQWKVVGQRKFRSNAEAVKFMDSKGFKKKPATMDLTSRFKRLPAMSRVEAVASGEIEGANIRARRGAIIKSLNERVQKAAADKSLTPEGRANVKNQAAIELYTWDRDNTKTISTPEEARDWGAREYLGKVEEDLDAILRAYNRQTGRVPEAVQSYAQEFSQHYYKVTGKPPFSKQLRLDTVGMPHVSDYGPEPGMGSALGGMVEDANAYDIESRPQELPEEIRQMANIRVGKTMGQMSNAASQIIDTIKNRPALGLTQTRDWLVAELEKTKKILDESKNMKDVEGAQARMNELRRTAVAYEKLRHRIRPTALSSGEFDEIRELKRAARANVAGARSTLRKVTQKTGGAFPVTPKKLSELDLLPANEEVMRILSQVGEGSDAIMEGPHGEQYIATMPHDYEAGGHIFYPNVLGISTLSKSDILETAQRVAAAQKQQTLWAEAAMKTQRIIPEPQKLDVRTDINLVRYKATGQIAEIIDSPENVLTSPEVLVRFLDGSEMTVAKSELSLPAPGKGDWARDYRLAEYVLDGRYSQMYRREPPLGFGKLEKDLGVFGTRDRSVIAGAIYDRAQELSQQVRRRGEGYKETWNELFELHRRARLLDEAVETERLPMLSTKVLQEEQAGKFLPRERMAGPGFGEETIVGEQVPTRMGEAQPNPEYRSTFESAEPIAERGTAQLAGETPTTQIHAESVVTKKVLGQPAEERIIKKVKLLRSVKAGSQNMGDIVLEAIRERDPKLVNPFKRASYEKMIQQLGDDPFAELQAQSLSGYLTDEQASTLRGYADEIGLPKGLSLPRIVVEMRERQALDPMAALYAVQTRKQAAILNWSEQAAGGRALFSGIPIGGTGERGRPNIIIKPVASLHDLRFGGLVGSSWKVASKHPFTQHIMNMLYRAQETEKRSVIKRSREFLVHMEQLGLKFKDRNAIRDVILDAHNEGWKTWDQVVANHPTIKKLSAEERQLYSQGYFSYRRFYAERKQDLIRHFMRRKVKPIIFDPENAEHAAFAQALAKEYGVDMSTLREGSALMPFQPELIYKNPKFADFGMAPRGYNEDEINLFLKLQEQFGSAAELPLEAPHGIRPKIYEEFKETFDFWQRYGHDNYWPLVHEGSIAALDKSGKIVAWGQSIPDVIEGVRDLRKQERLGADEPVTIQQVGMVADDIIMQATQNKGELRQLEAFYAEHLNMDPDEVMVLMERSDRPQAIMKRPGQVHGKPRKAGLKPVTIDADKEFSLYNARIARMDYRWDVHQAWRAFQDSNLDRALSDAYKAPRLHESMPDLKSYMEDVFTTAVGERRASERFADNMWMIFNMASQAPREFMAGIRGERNWLGAGGILDPKTYYRKYAARARASDLLGIQTLWKLGFSGGSAFANWTQFFITTVPKLVQPGEDIGHVAKLVWGAQKDAFRIFRDRYPLFGQAPEKILPDLRVLMEMLDESGIDLLPAKQMAGGRSIGDVLGGSPIKGESKLAYANDWIQHKALYAFNGAEKMNRFGTGIVAIRRYADRLGKPLEKLTSIERAEAVESARRLVRETQFLYDELSLPRALRSGPLAGPLGRILFQFKPFLLNMMEYEAGLVKNAFFNPATRGGKIALGQLGAHFGAIGVLGGAVGLLYNPFVSIPYQIINWMTGGNVVDPATRLSAAQRKHRRQMQSPEENFQQSSNYTASDLLTYGLPGLIGLDMGQRVGVSGQDLMMTIDLPNILGPHASQYYNLVQAWAKYGGAKGSGAAKVGAAVGALATTLLPNAVKPYLPPWAATVGSTTGAVLASRGSFNDFGSFLRNTPEGQKMFQGLLPTAVRNARRTFELVSQGVMRDMDGKPMHVPASDRFEQATALLLGVPTVRRQEYTAMISMLNGSSSTAQNTGYILTKKAARAWADADYGTFYEIMLQAQENDIDISQRAIEQELNDMTQERMTSAWQRLPRNEKLR